MVNCSLIISVVAAAAIQSVSGRVQKQCTNEAQSLLLIRDGLDDFKKLNKKAGSGKLTFIAGTDDLSEKAKNVVKKYGKWSVVWELGRDELRDARKLRKKSKKLKKTIKKMIKTYKKSTGKELKMVILPSSTSKRIVKAFEKRGIRVIKPDTTLSKSSKVEKFMKKVRKVQKKNTSVGKIVSFQVSDKLDAKKLKKLRRALSVVTAKKCFNVEIKEKKKEAQSGINLNSDINNKSKSCSQSVDNNSGSDLEHVASEGDLVLPFSVAAPLQPISAGILAQPESEDNGVDHVSDDDNIMSAGALVQPESEGDDIDPVSNVVSEGNLVQPESEADNVSPQPQPEGNNVNSSDDDLAQLGSEFSLIHDLGSEGDVSEGDNFDPISQDDLEFEGDIADPISEDYTDNDHVSDDNIIQPVAESNNVDPESEDGNAIPFYESNSFDPESEDDNGTNNVIIPSTLITPSVPVEPLVSPLIDNDRVVDNSENDESESDSDHVDDEGGNSVNFAESEAENSENESENDEENGNDSIASGPNNIELNESGSDVIPPVEAGYISEAERDAAIIRIIEESGFDFGVTPDEIIEETPDNVNPDNTI